MVRDIAAGIPVRRFGVNGLVVECEGRPDNQGVYRAVLRQGEREVWGDDFMSLLITQFTEVARNIQRAPLVPGGVGLRNLELQVQIMQKAHVRGTGGI